MNHKQKLTKAVTKMERELDKQVKLFERGDNTLYEMELDDDLAPAFKLSDYTKDVIAAVVNLKQPEFDKLIQECELAVAEALAKLSMSRKLNNARDSKVDITSIMHDVDSLISKLSRLDIDHREQVVLNYASLYKEAKLLSVRAFGDMQNVNDIIPVEVKDVIEPLVLLKQSLIETKDSIPNGQQRVLDKFLLAELLAIWGKYIDAPKAFSKKLEVFINVLMKEAKVDRENWTYLIKKQLNTTS